MFHGSLLTAVPGKSDWEGVEVDGAYPADQACLMRRIQSGGTYTICAPRERTLPVIVSNGQAHTGKCSFNQSSIVLCRPRLHTRLLRDARQIKTHEAPFLPSWERKWEKKELAMEGRFSLPCPCNLFEKQKAEGEVSHLPLDGFHFWALQ
jgi:hypothetical protein